MITTEPPTARKKPSPPRRPVTTTPAPTPPEPTLDDLLKVASVACREAGYPVHDDEYQSEIALAVVLGMRNYPRDHPSTTCTLLTWCKDVALNRCQHLAARLATLRKGDEAGAKRGLWMPPTETPIPLADFELLQFVACHGKTKAAKLLGLQYYKLIALLEDVQLRLRR